MRKFWQSVLLCTALLMAASLAHAQTPPGSSPRSTSSGTGSAFTPVAPTLPSATQPAETKPAVSSAASTAPGTPVVVVEDARWRNLDAFSLTMIMVAAIAAIVLVYYIFLRKRTD